MLLPRLGERFIASVERLKQVLSSLPRGDDDDHDTGAWQPAPRKPNPTPRRGAVAVAEPDE